MEGQEVECGHLNQKSLSLLSFQTQGNFYIWKSVPKMVRWSDPSDPQQPSKYTL